MKLFKSIKLLLAAAAISFAAGTASAATHYGTSALTFDGDVAVFGNTFAKNSGFNAFDDIFTFTIPALSTGDLGASVIAGVGKTGFNTLFNSFILFQSVPGPDTLISSAPPGPVAILTASNLTAGDYYFRVQGSVLGTNGGSYGGNASLTVTAVPEPGEWALMLSGFGLIALMVRRRTANGS